jgi:hypothetical protein
MSFIPNDQFGFSEQISLALFFCFKVHIVVLLICSGILNDECVVRPPSSNKDDMPLEAALSTIYHLARSP